MWCEWSPCSRDLKRLIKRRRNVAEWELIDHKTRKTRIEQVGEDDDDDDADSDEE